MNCSKGEGIKCGEQTPVFSGGRTNVLLLPASLWVPMEILDYYACLMCLALEVEREG